MSIGTLSVCLTGAVWLLPECGCSQVVLFSLLCVLRDRKCEKMNTYAQKKKKVYVYRWYIFQYAQNIMSIVNVIMCDASQKPCRRKRASLWAPGCRVRGLRWDEAVGPRDTTLGDRAQNSSCTSDESITTQVWHSLWLPYVYCARLLLILVNPACAAPLC